jgi:hypothetical protein
MNRPSSARGWCLARAALRNTSRTSHSDLTDLPVIEPESGTPRVLLPGHVLGIRSGAGLGEYDRYSDTMVP